jgi:hypothetical protein
MPERGALAETTERLSRADISTSAIVSSQGRVLVRAVSRVRCHGSKPM